MLGGYLYVIINTGVTLAVLYYDNRRDRVFVLRHHYCFYCISL